MVINPIAKIQNDFPSKFGIPRQSGRIPELTGKIIFEKNLDMKMPSEGLNSFLIFG